MEDKNVFCSIVFFTFGQHTVEHLVSWKHLDGWARFPSLFPDFFFVIVLMQISVQNKMEL